MSYRFIEEREPTQQELTVLMEAAARQAKKKSEMAYQQYMMNIHQKLLKLKKQKCNEA